MREWVGLQASWLRTWWRPNRSLTRLLMSSLSKPGNATIDWMVVRWCSNSHLIQLLYWTETKSNPTKALWSDSKATGGSLNDEACYGKPKQTEHHPHLYWYEHHSKQEEPRTSALNVGDSETLLLELIRALQPPRHEHLKRVWSAHSNRLISINGSHTYIQAVQRENLFLFTYASFKHNQSHCGI